MSNGRHRPQRTSLRLRDYDYTDPGAYFITICVQGRASLFGVVELQQVVRTAAGEMVLEWWRCLGTRFRAIEPCAFVVMPNHVHGLISIAEHTTAPIPTVVQWFKTMTTNHYIRGVRERGWPPFQQRLWQRSYFERVIRSADEFAAAQRYIEENPLRWDRDGENPDARR